MKKILTVPYYSQRLDVTDPKWQPRACSIITIKTVAEFCGVEKRPADEWIEEGLVIGARDEVYGWKHTGLVMLLRNHGVLAYSQEFKSILKDALTKEMKEDQDAERFFLRGIEKIARAIDADLPTIISIRKKFTEINSHHSVVVVGYTKDETGILQGFYYHDPDSTTVQEGKELFVSREIFMSGWKHLAIFVEK